jgi:hypothetical protein
MLNRLQDVFASLEKHQVEYVIIGGIASILHGVPRATFDLDLLSATPENADRLLAALLEAGLGTASLTTTSRLLANEITFSTIVFASTSRLLHLGSSLIKAGVIGSPWNLKAKSFLW